MTKKTQTKKSSPFTPTMLIAAGVLLILAVAGLALLNRRPAQQQPQAIANAQLIAPSKYQELFPLGTPHQLIDVRTPEEFASGHIPNAVNISVESLPQRLDEVSMDTPVVVYCRSGNRSATAAGILVEAGYGSVYDLGGIQTWTALGLPTE